MIEALSTAALRDWLADESRAAPVLLDVRQPWEYEYCRIEGSLSIPLKDLPARYGELPRGRALVVICHHGVRSLQAAQWLEQSGFPALYNLHGGVSAWADQVEPAMPRY